MIIHNGYKILSDMPKFVFYLYQEFKPEMLAHGTWPKTNQEEIVHLFEWYATKLRPFMWEFYGIMSATNQAGLTNNSSLNGGADLNSSNDGINPRRSLSPRSNKDLDKHNKSNLLLQKVHDEYMTRFKYMCEQMESKFFLKGDKTTQFICSDKPTCIDYVYYQELLSAMVLSGNGSQSEFFSADTATRLYKL